MLKINISWSLCYLAASLALAQSKPVGNGGEWRQSLDGPWAFTTEPAKLAEPASAWDKINVPGNWDTLPAYTNYIGKGWYQRDFTVPSSWNSKHIRLKFNAVYNQTEVSLNGKPLGSHFGGYTPFEFDITDAVKFGQPNTLTVCANNSYKRGAWWAWGGISRSVELIANNDSRIVWQHIYSDPDLDKGSAKLNIRYQIANSGTSEQTAKLNIAITGPDQNNITPAKPESLDLHDQIPSVNVLLKPGENFNEVNLELTPGQVKLWHFEHPNLYTITTTLTDSSGNILHQQTDRFGIRKIEVTKDGLFLNGEQIRVPGMNRVSEYPGYGNTEPDIAVHKDIDLMKECGAVFSRIMHMPQAPNLLDYMDEKGMLVICEIPVWGSDDPQVKKDNPLTKQWLSEMINRDYNHPCIIGWSPGNEITHHDAYVRSMFDYIHQNLDPYRLTTYASYTAARKDYGPSNDPAGAADFIMLNSYNDNGNSAKTLRERWPDKAVFYSEFGTKQFGENLSGKIPNIEKCWHAAFNQHPYVIGMSLWTFNDYRNGYALKNKSGKESPVRSWGIVDINRNKKAAYDQVRKLFSPVRDLYVKDGNIMIRPRTNDEVPCYALRGYHLAWRNGDNGNNGTLPLPDILPGSPELSIPIPAAADNTASVWLVSPTGYQMTENLDIVSSTTDGKK